MGLSNIEGLAASKRIYWASGIVSICGIIFEVLLGALGSYILGDGIKQYTLTIALFLTGMGIGAFFSEKVMKRLITTFVWVEFSVAVIGGFSSLIMFGITAYLPQGTAPLYLYSVILIIGGLTGIELPILIRKANEIGVAVNKSTARVLFSDYAGGLIGGLLFAYWFRPEFGLVKTAFIVGLINLVTAFWLLFTFRKEVTYFRQTVFIGFLIMVSLVWGVLFGDEAALNFEKHLYRDPIIYAKETPYQRIVMTKEQGDLRLYLNGNLQFSSTDEYRYHEVLVHPTVSLAKTPKHVLILGGGDGLATRELLEYPFIKTITLVDLDPAMTNLASNHPLLTNLNNHSLSDKRVHVKNKDAFEFLESSQKLYDVILIDLPDPNDTAVGKLYTKEFYMMVKNHLKPGGAVMMQATSPVFATKVFWTINRTVKATGLHTQPLHVSVPSFGEWGFVLASRHPFDLDKIEILDVDTKFLTNEVLDTLGTFGNDMDKRIKENGEIVDLPVNTLIHPVIVEMYQKAWLYY